MTRPLALLACLTALVAAPPVAAGAGPASAHLDRSFGKAGVARTALGTAGQDPVVAVGVDPDGSPVVADPLTGAVVRFRPTGFLDDGFASAGRLQVAPGFIGAGGRRFLPRSTVVDGAGRVLVFGAISRPEPMADGPEGVPISPSSAAVIRFTAAGRLDRSFGEGKGYFEGDFGIPAEPSTGFARAEALAGAVDSEDRPVLVVGERASVGGCSGKPGVAPQPREVVRLTPSGQIDPAFGGGDGIAPIDGTGAFPFLGVDAADQPAVGVGRPTVGCGSGNTVYSARRRRQPAPRFRFRRRDLLLPPPCLAGRTLGLADPRQTVRPPAQPRPGPPRR